MDMKLLVINHLGEVELEFDLNEVEQGFVWESWEPLVIWLGTITILPLEAAKVLKEQLANVPVIQIAPEEVVSETAIAIALPSPEVVTDNETKKEDVNEFTEASIKSTRVLRTSKAAKSNRVEKVSQKRNRRKAVKGN